MLTSQFTWTRRPIERSKHGTKTARTRSSPRHETVRPITLHEKTNQSLKIIENITVAAMQGPQSHPIASAFFDRYGVGGRKRYINVNASVGAQTHHTGPKY